MAPERQHDRRELMFSSRFTIILKEFEHVLVRDHRPMVLTMQVGILIRIRESIVYISCKINNVLFTFHIESLAWYQCFTQCFTDRYIATDAELDPIDIYRNKRYCVD